MPRRRPACPPARPTRGRGALKYSLGGRRVRAELASRTPGRSAVQKGPRSLRGPAGVNLQARAHPSRRHEPHCASSFPGRMCFSEAACIHRPVWSTRKGPKAWLQFLSCPRFAVAPWANYLKSWFSHLGDTGCLRTFPALPGCQGSEVTGGALAASRVLQAPRGLRSTFQGSRRPALELPICSF